MNIEQLRKCSDYEWLIEPTGQMKVPVVIFASESLVRAMDEKVREQAINVACLPGIVQASYVMPDAHWGYGFPIGGVAAFDPDQGGVISAGGVGFDISCGVRTITTGLAVDDIKGVKERLADMLAQRIPAGVGSTGKLHLGAKQMDEVLTGGARWAVDRGFGTKEDLEYIEEHGTIAEAEPAQVSDQAKKRQQDEMGTLGSGNHYMEVQWVEEVYDQKVAAAFGIKPGDIVISLHCGSRGLGHQIGTEFLKKMAGAAAGYGFMLPDKELACAPLNSSVGREYLGAMRSAINCALANRQILTDLVRKVFAQVLPKAQLKLLYDVSHNTCKQEQHEVAGKSKRLFVHRKGATRSLGPGEPTLPANLRQVGQPVLIGGSMGTASYILVGTGASMSLALGSSCHGAGRSMSRHQATRTWHGKDIVRNLESQGILIRSPSYRGVAEEAPGAYKDVSEVVEAAHRANLSYKVAKLLPLICVKG